MNRAILPAAITAVLLLAGCSGTPSASSATSSGTSAAGGDACSASPTMMVGPYFLDGKPYRSDIRNDYPNAQEAENEAGEEDQEGPYEDADEEFIDEVATRSELRLDQQGQMQEGVELRLAITVHERGASGTCSPMAGARVDVWHANAHGKYSGYTREGTAGESWLRGALETDANGQVTFTTIWPGWYPGRAVHIHVKVREGDLDFTSQFFFDPAANAQVMQGNAPYNLRPVPDTPNASDGIYREGGNNMILATQQANGAWTGSKAIVVQG